MKIVKRDGALHTTSFELIIEKLKGFFSLIITWVNSWVFGLSNSIVLNLLSRRKYEWEIKIAGAVFHTPNLARRAGLNNAWWSVFPTPCFERLVARPCIEKLTCLTLQRAVWLTVSAPLHASYQLSLKTTKLELGTRNSRQEALGRFDPPQCIWISRQMCRFFLIESERCENIILTPFMSSTGRRLITKWISSTGKIKLPKCGWSISNTNFSTFDSKFHNCHFCNEALCGFGKKLWSRMRLCLARSCLQSLF